MLAPYPPQDWHEPLSPSPGWSESVGIPPGTRQPAPAGSAASRGKAAQTSASGPWRRGREDGDTQTRSFRAEEAAGQGRRSAHRPAEFRLWPGRCACERRGGTAGAFLGCSAGSRCSRPRGLCCPCAAWPGVSAAGAGTQALPPCHQPRGAASPLRRC